MTEAPTLFDAPPARPMLDIPLSYRNSDPVTSREAAEANRPRRNNQQQKVWDALVQAGEHGANASELASRLGMEKNTVARRLTDLGELGLASKTDVRRVTNTGCRGVVWCAFADAQAADAVCAACRDENHFDCDDCNESVLARCGCPCTGVAKCPTCRSDVVLWKGPDGSERGHCCQWAWDGVSPPFDLRSSK